MIVEEPTFPHESLKSIDKIVSMCFYKRKELKHCELVYYYTDIDALLNGIIVPAPDKDKEVCLWATRCTHMNDKREMREGIESLRQALDKAPERLITTLYGFVNRGHSISFSITKDSLPMWNMYGKNCTGVMLAFETSYLINRYTHFFQPCVYTGSYYYNRLYKRFKNIDFGEPFNLLSDDHKVLAMVMLSEMYIMLMKNNAFAYEQESRIIGLGTFCDSSDRTAFFRNCRGIITPYFKEYFPKSTLREIWLGPNQDMDLSAETLKEFLKQKGFDHTIVHKSAIPYRG